LVTLEDYYDILVSVNFFAFNYSKFQQKIIKKCYKQHSLHRKPSHLFAVFSKFAPKFISIFHQNSFKGFISFSPFEHYLSKYRLFIKNFVKFLALYFNVNFALGSSLNLYYNPKIFLLNYLRAKPFFFKNLFRAKILYLRRKKVSLHKINNLLNRMSLFLLTKRRLLFRKKYIIDKRRKKKFN